MKDLVGTTDIVFITLDSLRYDAAQHAFETGRIPNIARYLGHSGWEKRHTPASFTYAAHQAFFTGFLPTPCTPGIHPRLFASEFSGSVSTASETFLFTEATLPEALAARGYHTICIGGTGFFNQQNSLSRVLPSLFSEAHWREELGVTSPTSPDAQVGQALQCVDGARSARIFLFINVSAIHQPNWYFQEGPRYDSLASHTAALAAVDRSLGRLFERMNRRGPTFVLLCSDHGTAYGEDGYTGHRIGHEVVWTVPYAHFLL